MLRHIFILLGKISTTGCDEKKRKARANEKENEKEELAGKSESAIGYWHRAFRGWGEIPLESMPAEAAARRPQR